MTAPRPGPPPARTPGLPEREDPLLGVNVTLLHRIREAIRRDDALNDAEAETYVRTLERLRRRQRPGSDPMRLIPADTVREFRKPLRTAGWTLTQSQRGVTGVVIEGVDNDDTAIMITHRLFRSRHFYVLHAPGTGPAGWVTVGFYAFNHFVQHRALPAGAMFSRPYTGCRCGKVRFATQSRAARALLSMRIEESFHHGQHRAECRAYRCPDDMRAWHLTSRAVWLPNPPAPPAERPGVTQEST